MVSMPKEVMDLVRTPPIDLSMSKVIATISDQGVPNITPMGSITAIDSETVAFADGATVHTRENLQGKNKNVAFMVCQRAQPMTAYQVKGTFVGFQTSGPIYDNFAKMFAARGMPAPRAVGLVKVDEIYSSTPGQNSRKLA
jgi:uncharacterized protein